MHSIQSSPEPDCTLTYKKRLERSNFSPQVKHNPDTKVINDPDLRACKKGVILPSIVDRLRDCTNQGCDKDLVTNALKACLTDDVESLQTLLDNGRIQPKCVHAHNDPPWYAMDSRYMNHGLLFTAASNNSIECVKLLHERHWKLDERVISRKADGREYGRSALTEALLQLSIEVVRYMLDHGAMSDEQFYHALFASYEEHPEVIESLILRIIEHARNGLAWEVTMNTLADRIISEDRHELITRLSPSALHRLQNLNLSFACQRTCSDRIFDLLLPRWQPERTRPMHVCIRQHEHSRALRLVHHRGKPLQSISRQASDTDVSECLNRAADAGCTFMLHELLERGLDVDFVTCRESCALYQACASRNATTGALQMLLGRGADPNVIIDNGVVGRSRPKRDWIDYSSQDDMAWELRWGCTPLHAVCLANAPFEETSRRVRMLFAAGADLDMQQIEGDTPLHYDARRIKTAHFQRYEITPLWPLLMELGADQTVRNRFGQTAEDIRKGCSIPVIL